MNSKQDSQPWKKPQSGTSLPDDEGGLRAPPGLTSWRKAWWWFDFIILVKLARLRFIAVLVAIGAVITQWDTLSAYFDKWTRPSTVASTGGGDVEWFCPMHPSVVRDNAKDKCPVCFMPLSKRKKGEGTEEALPPGTVNRVQLSPYRIVLAGVETTQVDYRPLFKEITAVGSVEFSEQTQRTVAARVKGRIDKLFVNETGRMVNVGDDLAYLYSPDLNVTVQNLLDARHNGNREHERSALKRLDLLGIGEDQLDAVKQVDGKASSHLKIRSPISGHVIKKYVREGQYIDEGMPLYDIVDLSTVWILAQIYEDDMGFLPVAHQYEQSNGAEPTALAVTATARAFPDESFHGTLSFVYPHVDQNTRTVAVRFTVENREHLLRPGNTANVTLMVAPREIRALVASAAEDSERSENLRQGNVLCVPESSVIDTGTQKIVYRLAAPGTFEGVKVALGPRMSDTKGTVFYPVLRGIEQGDRIVTAGSFLVDAETRLNPAAGSIYFGGSGGSKSISAVTNVRPSTPEDDDAKASAGLAKLMPSDRVLAESQAFCPILPDSRLGSMGTPVKLVIEGRPVFLCCDGCRKAALASPKSTIEKLDKLQLRQQEIVQVAPIHGGDTASPEVTSPVDEADPEIEAALAELSPEDRQLAVAQRFCAVMPTSRLGAMGAPVKVLVKGEPVFLCCDGCKDSALEHPDKTLASLKKLKATANQGTDIRR